MATLAQIQRTLAKRVRLRRKALGLSQEQLAERATLDVRHVQKIEAADINMTLATLCKISSALRLPITDLLSDG